MPSSTTPGACWTPMNGVCCASWLFFGAASPWRRPTAVAGATLANLEALVDKSWLRVQERRFTLHELMRQYCVERLDQDHEIETGEAADEVHRRHCLYFAGMTGAEEKALNWQHEPMTLFRADFGNLEAAWLWALAQGEIGAIRQMAEWTLYYIAEMTGWFGAMIPLLSGQRRPCAPSGKPQAVDSSPCARKRRCSLTFMLYIQAC